MNYWQGTHVRLRGIEPSDAEAFFAWNQDSDMGRHLDRLWPPGSLERAKQLTQKEATQEPSGDELRWVIEDRQGEFAGMIDTHHCDRRTGCFMYAVAIHREHQRKGYASEAITLVLRYFFEELRYQKVTVDVHGDNPASIALHEKLGFQLEGRIRRMVFAGGKHYDSLIYGLTAEEFQAAYPSASGGAMQG
jgi:RimJ/RimL family protein N-acetyltransferase